MISISHLNESEAQPFVVSSIIGETANMSLIAFSLKERSLNIYMSTQGENLQAVIQLCKELINAPSVSGEEQKAVQVLERYYRSRGINDLYVDEYGSLIAGIRGNRPGKTILFDGHIDVVPVADPAAWSTNPYVGEIIEDRLYGRGASDMKGAVSAMTVAACDFYEATRGDFAGTILIASVVQEERFEGVAARAISAKFKPDIVVIGESTNLNLNIGQRGRAEIQLESFGSPAHSSNPEKGFNAVYALCDILNDIRRLPTPTHPVLGKGILELTDIVSSPYPGASVVPEYCVVTFDRRLLPGETPDDVLKPLQQIIDEHMSKNSKCKFSVRLAPGKEICYTGAIIEAERFFPGWLFDEKEPFVLKALNKLHEVGINSKISHYNFCTNGSHYAGEANIPTIGIGPSVESLAHVVDEYIDIDQLLKAVVAYKAIMEAFTMDS